MKRRHLEALTSGRSEAQSVKEWAGKRVTAAFLSAHVEYKAHYFEALGRYCAGAAALERSIANTDENDCAIALAELALSVKKHGEAIATAKSFVAAARPVCYVHDPTLALHESQDLVKRVRPSARLCE